MVRMMGKHEQDDGDNNGSNDNHNTDKNDKDDGDSQDVDPIRVTLQRVVEPRVVTTNNDPSTMTNEELMSSIGTTPRRIVLSLVSSTGIALAANFLGVTSRLLEALPESTVEASGLDTYYPRGDFKRFKGQGYSFVVLKEWVADTAVELAKAQRRTGALDYGMKRRSGSGVLPDAAFGPPGRLNARGVSTSDTNVSVVVSTVMSGFSLRGTLGTPTSAAETLLRVSLAPEGSGRVATLINAEEDAGRQVYQFEYNIDRGDRGPLLRAISVIAERNGDTLLTLTIVAPEQDWKEPSYEKKLRKIATSFQLDGR